jgi:chromosome segregation ATPase
MGSQSDGYKNKVSELEQVVEKLTAKLDALGQEKRNLEKEVGRGRAEEKERKQLQERIAGLEEELRQSQGFSSTLCDKLKLQEDKLHEHKSSAAVVEARLPEQVRRCRDDEAKLRAAEAENDTLRRELWSREKHSEELRKNIDSLGFHSKAQDDKNREDLKSLKLQCENFRHQVETLVSNLGAANSLT